MTDDVRGSKAAQQPAVQLEVSKPGRLAKELRPIDALTGLESAFLAFLQSRTPGAVIPVERRIFLTMSESAEYSGLPVAFLRKLIAAGKLKALKTGAGWRISRAEIEALSGTLTVQPAEMTEHELRDIELNRRRRQGLA